MKNYLTITVLLVVSVILFQTIWVLNTANFISNQPEYVAKVAVGSTYLCINRPGEVIVNCPQAFNQSTSLENWTQECSLDLAHPFGFRMMLSVVELRNGLVFYFAEDNQSFFITGNQSAVGNNTIGFLLEDLSQCPIPIYFDLEFELLDINDPPELKKLIPSQSLDPGVARQVFVLNDHFYDPDGDNLTYTFSSVGNFRITIANSSLVTITNPAGNCQDGFVYFTAKDPGNLTVDSNMVELKSLCTEVSSASGASGAAAPSCTPEWQCRRWSNCLENGSRYRQCFDINACDLNRLERIFWEECEYIEPQDPPTPPSPEEELEEQEEEIRIETPDARPFEEQDSFLTYILIGLLTSAVLSATYLTFRKQIRTMYAKIMWYLTKKRRKELLLSDKDKKTLLKKIAKIELNINVKPKYLTTSQVVQDIINLYRSYFSLAFKIPVEFNKKDASLKIEKLVHKDLKEALNRALNRTIILERHKLLLSQEYTRMLIQGLRAYIFSTSNTTKEDADFKVVELIIKGDSSQKIIALIHNAYVALQFLEIEQAKKNYIKTLQEYENLSEKEKISLQPEIFQLYYHISYVVSWIQKGKDL
ncbi:MAG: hypothetical protein ACMXX9_01395 [Candidatus Woesearchaeota archaeon]